MNRNTNPGAHNQAALYVSWDSYIVASHLKILIPVGTVMIIVADVKYARYVRNVCFMHVTHRLRTEIVEAQRLLEGVS